MHVLYPFFISILKQILHNLIFDLYLLATFGLMAATLWGLTSVLCDLNLSCFQMYKMKRHCIIAPNEIICDLFIICHLFFNHVLVQSYTMSLSLSWLHYVDNVLVAKSQIQTTMRLANTSEKLSWQLSQPNITNIQLFSKMTVVTYLWMFTCLLWLAAV